MISGSPVSSEAVGASPSVQGADLTVPVMAGALAASSITTSSFTLSWLAASDNVAVVGYQVSTNGGAWADLGNVLSTAQSGLAPATLSGMQVRAYDAAGNFAVPLSLAVTTLALPVIPVVPSLTGTIQFRTLPRSVRQVIRLN